MRIPATKAKCLCDKCGKEIEVERYGVAPTVIELSVSHAWHDRANTNEKFEFCNTCWRTVYESLKAVLTRK